jgi:lipoate-protein ligase B
MTTAVGYRVDLPLMTYAEAQVLQGRCVTARENGRLERDLLLLVEHPPVFTLGRNGGRENLAVSDRLLAEKGVQVVQAERGGNITYHGPGQLVGYPIVDLEARRMSVTDYVSSLEAVLMEAVAESGVSAGRNPLNPGVWVGEAKLASIGLCLRHGIAFHGFALNVNNDLTPFGWINPCGLKGVSMTSLSRERGVEVDMADVRGSVGRAFSKVFRIRFIDIKPASMDAVVEGDRSLP